MKTITATLILALSWASMAKEYAIVSCFNHVGDGIAYGTYSFEEGDLSTQNDTGFSISKASKLRGNSAYRIKTNCEDKSKEYRVIHQETLFCASGVIQYAEGPFCDGEEYH